MPLLSIPESSTQSPIRYKINMECISCGSDEVFNRAIINQLSGEGIGFYCEDCESKEFGGLLDNEKWHQENGCAFCENSGKYKLPKLDCVIERDNGSIRVIEYQRYEYKITLCSDHTETVLGDETSLADLTTQDRETITKIEA